MPQKKKERIFRAGALLVTWMQRCFYAMALGAAAAAILANFVSAAWSDRLISLSWFLLGAAVMGIVLFVLANLIADRDIPDLASSTSGSQ